MSPKLLILALVAACTSPAGSDAGPHGGDAESVDAGPNGADAGTLDAGSDDAGPRDASADDSGSNVSDAGTLDAGTLDASTFDAGTPELPPTPTPTPITLAEHYFRGDATAPRSVSAWGIESYPDPVPASTRSTVFWGHFQDDGCRSPGYGLNTRQALTGTGLPVFQAFYPTCASSYGPSVDADAYAYGAPQHLLRSEVTPDGAFQAYGPEGQNASGANAHIHAAYTSFNTPWRSNIPNRLRPWGGPSATPDQIRFALIVEQSVTRVVLEDPAQQQLQQVLWMNVINEACDIATSSSFCQLQLNLKTYIRGVGSYTRFDEGSAFNDGGQGGLIAVVGPIAASGASTSVGGSSAWTSWGSSTQVSRFEDERFQVEMSWAQFQDLLRNVTGGDPASVFGAQWQDRNTWVMLDVGYGQENYNASSTATSAIEGLFEFVEVIAL